MITTNPYIKSILDQYIPPKIQQLVEHAGIPVRVVPVESDEDPKYLSPQALSTMSIAYRRDPRPLFMVEGMFVPEERAVFVAPRPDPFAVVHELGHALVYIMEPFTTDYESAIHTSLAARLLNPLMEADLLQPVTPYSASTPNEYLAECFALWSGASIGALQHLEFKQNIPSFISAMFRRLKLGEDPQEVKRKAEQDVKNYVATHFPDTTSVPGEPPLVMDELLGE